MATPGNPLTGASWGTSPIPNPGLFSGPVQPSPQVPNPGGLEDPGSNIKDIMRNTGLVNLQTGTLRNQMIPEFANMMFGAAGPARDFFANLMNLGSPYYQQKQREGFTQGVQQNQNAAAQARQQLSAQGYGATPSGATAGMIGGMNMQGAQSLAEQYLQNLFQNENMQLQGGQGLAGLAGMFNPSSLFGNVSTPGSTQGPSAAEQVAAILGGVFGGGQSTRQLVGGK